MSDGGEHDIWSPTVEDVEENGEDPPAEFMEDARRETLRSAAKQRRDEHRDIYDALAEE